MDLVYTDKNGEDVGIIDQYAFDLAYGADENDFEIEISSDDILCEKGSCVYIDGTEYGGHIDEIDLDTKRNTVVYKGRTWHGIIAGKYIEPNKGEDYLTVSGDANAVLKNLIERIGLQDCFRVSDHAAGIQITKYRFNRYIEAYYGMCMMLASAGAKLHMEWKDGMVELSAIPLVDYASDDEFDSTQVSLNIKKKYVKTNHIICLGSGELADRRVIHLYCDNQGNISEKQSVTGMNEITEKLDYPNAESDDELVIKGTEKLRSYWNSDSVTIELDTDEKYDIGDIVGATEQRTGISVSAHIIKKIVKIKDGIESIEYKVGG